MCDRCRPQGIVNSKGIPLVAAKSWYVKYFNSPSVFLGTELYIFGHMFSCVFYLREREREILFLVIVLHHEISYTNIVVDELVKLLIEGNNFLCTVSNKDKGNPDQDPNFSPAKENRGVIKPWLNIVVSGHQPFTI